MPATNVEMHDFKAYQSSSFFTPSAAEAASQLGRISASIRGLSANLYYQFRVRSRNTAGPGPWSEASLRMKTQALTVPNSPRSIVVADVSTLPAAGSNQYAIKVQWQKPAPNGAQLIGYELQYRETFRGSWTRVRSNASQASSEAFRNLEGLQEDLVGGMSTSDMYTIPAVAVGLDGSAIKYVPCDVH